MDVYNSRNVAVANRGAMNICCCVSRVVVGIDDDEILVLRRSGIDIECE